MADIELVIKIPEEQYRTLNAKSQSDVVTVIDNTLLIKAIKNGVPLPKGHWKYLASGNARHLYCSECKYGALFESDFCPNCGAEMRGSKE